MKVMLQCDRFTEEQKKEVKADFLKYWPIEQDHTIPMDVKSSKMLEWWTNNLKLFSSPSLRLTDADFETMVYNSRLALR